MGKQISQGSKGVWPLARRARVHAPPEKRRQGASMELRRPPEGGKRSCSPSELTALREDCNRVNHTMFTGPGAIVSGEIEACLLGGDVS
jgi:hypothetical protein